jgi:hypothetical protein
MESMLNNVGTNRCWSSQVVMTTAKLVLVITLAVPLVGYGYLGTFTRQVLDDHCAARILARYGFWGSQIWTYRNHSGRVFSYFVRVATESLWHERIVPVLALTLLSSWLMVTVWALWQLGEMLGWRHGLLNSVVLSELLLFAMLRTGPDPGQSFYWETGGLTYTLPIILVSLYLGILLYYLKEQPRGAHRALILTVAGTICFCAAATSETNAAVQCAGLLGAIIVCNLAPTLTERVRRSLPVLYCGFAGSLISSIIVIGAPGNAVREAGVRSVAAPLSFMAVVAKSVTGSVAFIVDFLHHRPGAALALLLIPALSLWVEKSSPAEIPWRTAARHWLLACAFSFVLILASIAPGVFALSDLPPERSEFVTHWILLTTLLATGVVFSSGIRWVCGVTPSPLAVLAASVFILALILPWVLKSTGTIASSVRQSRIYAAEWDSEDAQIRGLKRHGNSNIVVPWNEHIVSGGNVTKLPWLSSDPTYWVNKCEADYYGLGSIRVPTSDPVYGK